MTLMAARYSARVGVTAEQVKAPMLDWLDRYLGKP